MLQAKKKLSVIIYSIFLISIAASEGRARDSMFICQLEGNKVGPKPADTRSNGSVIFFLDESKQELTYKVLVEKIQDANMARLHIGSADKGGQLAAWLYPAREDKKEKHTMEGEFNGTLADGVVRPEDLKNGITFEKLIDSLSNGNAYVNVHTEKFVTGAIRGQVYSRGFTKHMEKHLSAAGGSAK